MAGEASGSSTIEGRGKQAAKEMKSADRHEEQAAWKVALLKKELAD